MNLRKKSCTYKIDEKNKFSRNDLLNKFTAMSFIYHRIFHIFIQASYSLTKKEHLQ